MVIKLWLDDVREMPDDYNVWVQTVEDAILFLKSYEVGHIGFDHDLGCEKTGYDLAKWIELESTRGLPPVTWSIQSANPVGAQNITAAMSVADRVWRANRSICSEYQYYKEILNHFGDLEKTMHWFMHRDPALGMHTPLQLILNEKYKKIDRFVIENFLEE